MATFSMSMGSGPGTKTKEAENDLLLCLNRNQLNVDNPILFVFSESIFFRSKAECSVGEHNIETET